MTARYNPQIPQGFNCREIVYIVHMRKPNGFRYTTEIQGNNIELVKYCAERQNAGDRAEWAEIK